MTHNLKSEKWDIYLYVQTYIYAIEVRSGRFRWTVGQLGMVTSTQVAILTRSVCILIGLYLPLTDAHLHA